MVVYRNRTKSDYLGIPEALLDQPGPVSPEVTELLARAVLEKTPEADVAVAVTGHLGPQAPPELDGRAFVSLVWRGLPGESMPGRCIARALACRDIKSRVARQRRVVEQVLEFLAGELADQRASGE
jgi:nicotinamide mononucleotide (NMN) deamidase PncC